MEISVADEKIAQKIEQTEKRSFQQMMLEQLDIHMQKIIIIII